MQNEHPFWVDTRVTRRVLQCTVMQIKMEHHSVAVRRPLACGAVAAAEQVAHANSLSFRSCKGRCEKSSALGSPFGILSRASHPGVILSSKAYILSYLHETLYICNWPVTFCPVQSKIFLAHVILKLPKVKTVLKTRSKASVSVAGDNWLIA